jgi:glycosyltransferase involved in cell wall biosynthesis
MSATLRHAGDDGALNRSLVREAVGEVVARYGRPLRLLYLVPGHYLLPMVGPSRNVLSLARALAQIPGIQPAVAFRRVLQPVAVEGVEVLELEPDGPLPEDPCDDAAMRGIGVAEGVGYLRALDRFARSQMRGFDFILEKGWLFSGWLAGRAWACGRIGMAIENFVPDPNRHAQEGLAKRLRLEFGFRIARRNLKRLPRVIVETESLKRALIAAYDLKPERVAVVGLGLDRELFRPQPQAKARARLGIEAAAIVLLYVGVLDATHDLWPVLRALAAVDPARRFELHILGEGMRRADYERFVRAHGLAVHFHGRRRHEEVPEWIAAADLCLAPYDVSVFANHELGYSTLKVREYLACGRPVATVASGVLRSLVRHGESGFLLDHSEEAWRTLLMALPERTTLARMGAAAAHTPLAGWEDTACGYLGHCLALLAPSAETVGR